MNSIAKFLVAGGIASLINWLSRFVFSEIMPFTYAVAVAYVVGMVVGFVLYRNWVFERRGSMISGQIALFVIVNIFGMGAVALSSMELLNLTSTWFPQKAAEGSANLAGISIGAVVNYIGHRVVTFAARSTASQT
ncbi:GtrA family protein [Paraburkholderia bannensis]|uniref:GtrA family protein n=1 Tax=Paraburkholderia bannensis TaxID=765414 RepID=UPI002ABD5FE5|nr:GtrA family protein [Paraburkholderia bannensis]